MAAVIRRSEVRSMAGPKCEDCAHYDYDEAGDAFFCNMDLDEDEMERFLHSATDACPFYRRGDDYSSARKQ